LIKDVRPARDLLNEIVGDAEHLLRKRAPSLVT
jgi:hypothetical protein